MGAGKTSIGRKLAERMRVSFVDADHEIEKASGCTITEFFEKYGEKEFRRGEKRVIARLLKSWPSVLATGGGAFMDLETRTMIKNTAVSVWLNADLNTLDGRLARRSGRPLLQTKNPRATLQSLMEKRYPIYAEADMTVETTNGSVDVTVDKVYESINNYFSLTCEQK
jgi:shikimate kinase